VSANALAVWASDISDSIEYIDTVATEFKKRETMFYTCHCTGKEPFERLKKTLGDRIGYLAYGNVVICGASPFTF